MKTVRFHQTGGPDVLVYEDVRRWQVGTVLPLSRAVDAHRLLEGRKTTGKVVLQPWVDA
jgi:NADPH:quinone reductase-like Zn-dependent oxidoreductase